jgi:hypothetical protein
MGSKINIKVQNEEHDETMSGKFISVHEERPLR